MKNLIGGLGANHSDSSLLTQMVSSDRLRRTGTISPLRQILGIDPNGGFSPIKEALDGSRFQP